MERRTISELTTLYELEPSVRDVYVEGPTDRAFVTAIVRRSGLDHVQVREVELVSISSAQLAEFGLGVGCRQRVIALALLLERLSAVDLTAQVACVADADDEAGRPPTRTGILLLYTDASSMTVYAYAPTYIQWYLDVEVLGFPITGDQVLGALTPILRTLTATRRAFRALGIESAIVDPTRDCELAGHAVVFDSQRFITRCIHKAKAFGEAGQIEREIETQERELSHDPQLWVASEVFTGLLHWMIVRLRGADNTVAKHLLSRTLLLGIPLPDILAWPLFKDLMRRISNSAPAAPPA